MLVDDLRSQVRPRSAWEATDLGFAIVRANAARVFAVWVLTTLPVFILINGLAWLLGLLSVAPFVMWWLKPLFDRGLVFVLARAVFGQMPSVVEALAAQWSRGWPATAAWLTWRRLHPLRALLLPIDLLEGVHGSQRKERAQVLGRGDGTTAGAVTLVAANLEAMMYFSFIVLVLMFVPVEFLDESVQATFSTLFDNPPPWAQLLSNLAFWAATCIIEPFYIGAGFGLYLNRRMQLEAWDIELAFRRIATRLASVTGAILLACGLGLGTARPVVAASPQEHPGSEAPWTVHVDGESGQPAQASPTAGTAADPAVGKADGQHSELVPIQDSFGDAWRDDGKDFEAAVRKVYASQDLHPTKRVSQWRSRSESGQRKTASNPEWIRRIGEVVGFVFHYGLWIIAAGLLILVIANWRRWLPWITERVEVRRTQQAPSLHGIRAREPLPVDIEGAVRALLKADRVRDALALLYRAGVERLVVALGTPLPPGATEADCLRSARGLTDSAYAGLFARIVRAWQATAYAQRPAAPGEVEALLVAWQRDRAVVP